jgi:hypothetical protein
VPSGGTVQIPAVLTGGGTACVNISPGYGCNTVNGVFYPVLVANVDFDIQGYLTFAFQQSSAVASGLLYTATFTPAPEPGTALLLIEVFAIIAVWRCRNSLFRA